MKLTSDRGPNNAARQHLSSLLRALTKGKSTKYTHFRKNESKERIICWFCGRDLSQAHTIKYVDEGPVCSICVEKHALNAWAAENKNKDALAAETPTRANIRVGELL